MNRLILLGNGFDLAHGMATQYRDFMEDYIFNSFAAALYHSNYNDGLIAIRPKGYITDFGYDWQSGLRDYLDYFYHSSFLPLLRNIPNDKDGNFIRLDFEVTVKALF